MGGQHTVYDMSDQANFGGGLRAYRGFMKWRRTGFAPPSPQIVKEHVFARHGVPGATWVETGTFRGATTRFLRSLGGPVHTIEPAEKYYKRAAKRFAKDELVTVHFGTSEDVMPKLLPTLQGPVNFWLDGHYSAGSTFQGATDCPVPAELAAIDASMGQFDDLVVLIDDVRCFGSEDPQYSDYPSKEFLIDWATAHALRWSIEHDIFIAKSDR